MTPQAKVRAQPSTNGPLDAALQCLHAGISVVPIRRDGTKAPTVKWEPYQSRRATEAEARRWWGKSDPPGIATICGAVSGGLELIDFDKDVDTIFPAWRTLVEAERPGLLERLTIVKTPRPGYHVRYRCPDIDIPGNEKLATDPTRPGKEQTLIETRGEGGYALAPGCPVECHKDGRLYEHISGPELGAVANISVEEREILLRCARSFNREPPQEEPRTSATHANTSTDSRPGDEYNQRGPDWSAILEPQSWRVVHQRDGVRYWARPGKEDGWSATTGVCTSRDGHELLAVFSTNAAPFEGPSGGRKCGTYTKFSAYTLLNHRGDFSAAAQALRREGYGAPLRTRAGKAAATPAPNASIAVELGPLKLQPGTPHQTDSGKITVPVMVWRNGELSFRFRVSDANSGCKYAVNAIEHLLDGASVARAEINKVLFDILGEAARRIYSDATPAGPTIAEIVAECVPEHFQFTHRTAKGAWSESRGTEVARSEFCAHVPASLLDEASTAIDAPRAASGLLNRHALLYAVKGELEVVWSTLVTTLPNAPMKKNGQNGQDTTAARRFREAMIRLWTMPVTWEVVKGETVADGVNVKSSLISRVRSQRGAAKQSLRLRWVPIHPALNAWWRPRRKDDGEEIVYLAMHSNLCSQVKVELPDVRNQGDLTELGKHFGVLEDPPPGVPTKPTGGVTRLVVLSLAVTEELLENPAEWVDDSGQ